MSEADITIDFETRSEADLKKVGAYEYARHPSTELLCLSWRFAEDPWEKRVFLWHPGFEDLAYKQRAKVAERTKRDLPRRPDPVALFDAIAAGAIVEAHNVWFERCIWHFVCHQRMGWPDLIPENLRCSAAKAASFSLRRKLEHACKDLHLPIQKDMAGNRTMLKLSKPRKPTKRDPDSQWHQARADLLKTFAYNVDDVRAEECLSASLRDLPPTELELFKLDMKMNWRGLHVDRELIDAALDVGGQAESAGDNELDEITFGAVTKATQKVAFLDWMEEEGITAPTKFNKKSERVRTTEGAALQKLLDDDAAIAAWEPVTVLTDPEAKALYCAAFDGDVPEGPIEIANDRPDGQELPEHVRRAIEVWISVNQTSTKKYNAFARRTSDDDRVRETLLYHAASTGRWGGRGIQPQNLSREYPDNADEIIADIKTRDFDLLGMLYDPDNVQTLLKQVVRGAITAAPGHELMVSDASAIEARGVFWVSGHEQGLQAFRDIDAGKYGNKDIYCWMAEQIVGYEVTKGMKERQSPGKVAVLGCGYQMGEEKCVTYGESIGIPITPEMAKTAVQGYRTTNWPVVDFWGRANECAIAAVDEPGVTIEQNEFIRWGVRGRFLHCRLPSGRLLSYLDPEVQWGLTPWGQQVRQLTFMGTNTYTRQWERTNTYGGKLTENIVQALCRDIMAEAMLRVEAAGYPVVLTVHDEVVAEVPEGFGSLEEYNKLLAQPPAWATGFPIEWEGYRDVRYQKG